MSTNTTGRIIPIAIEDEMKKAYIDYSISVITSRALPNAYDGLKPVQRRILYAHHELGVHYNKPYKKTARMVGDILGKYHPHSDASIYDALVRLAQPWSLRYPLIDGQGNFGSVDGDKAAAMRYTEARLKAISEEGLLADLNKDTVDFEPNFDNSLEVPAVLPARLPNLLLNGCSGIAVGMATNMAPHNLREVIQAIKAYIDDNEVSIEALCQYVKAPDFPTGGIIYGYAGVKKALETGRGRVVVRAKADVEVLASGRERIVVTEIPYMVNKAQMIEKTAKLIKEKALEGISDLRDESDREGMRVVYDLKKDAVATVVLNNLFKKTNLQMPFSVNNVALVKGKPTLLNLKDLIVCYVDHRHDVVTRRTIAEHKKAKAQLHLLEGYLIALGHLDDIIKLIKAANDPRIAKEELMAKFSLSEIQAKAILEMRLQRLTGLERAKIQQQHKETLALIAHLDEILANKGMRMDIIKKELVALEERYGDERRTEIVYDADDFSIEDVIANEKMVITLSDKGYIKRTPLTIYKVQHRGGVGSKGVGSKKEDFLSHLFVASAHDYLLVFTEFGKVHWKKVYALPEGSKTSQGRSIKNVLELEAGDSIRSILKIEKLNDPAYVKGRYVTLCTEKGIIKKTPLEAFTRPRTKGIRAITFKEGDRLLEAKLTEEDHFIILALQSGKAIRFAQDEVRAMGRTAAGVRGITLANVDDKVVGMLSTPENTSTTLLVVSEKGYGKRSAIQDYRITRRGGKGIKTIQITSKTGHLVAIKTVESKDELMIMNASGITLRMAVESLRTMRRATQGVRLVRLKNDDHIASVAIIQKIQPES